MFEFLRSNKNSSDDELVSSVIIPEDNRKATSPSPKIISPKQPIVKTKMKQPQFVSELNSLGYDQERFLLEELAQSEKMVGITERQDIEQKRLASQMKIHDFQTLKSEGQILQNMFKRKVEVGNPSRAKQIQELVGASNRKVVQAQLKGQKHYKQNSSLIPKSKDDLKELQKVDKYRLLKIKNGEIKNKIGNLREQLEEQYYRKKAAYKLPNHQNVKNSDYYSIDNPRTKLANKFIHQLHQKRKSEMQRYAEYKTRKREEQQLKKSMMQEQIAHEREEKRMRMEELYAEKQMKRQMAEMQNEQKKSQIAQWSKIFQKQKPLHLRKQEEYFEKHVIPELYEREEALLQRKQQRRPIDMAEIEQHDERYMEFKKDDQIRKQAQIELSKEKEKEFEEQQSKYYKGKYRYIALEEIMSMKSKLEQDPAERDRIKKARQIVYGDYVKQLEAQKAKHQPYGTRDSQKKKFNKRVRNLNGSLTLQTSTEPTMSHRSSDPKVDGRKNLHFLHELVRQRGIKKDHPQIKLVEEKGVYTDYMAEAREKRRRSLNLSRPAPEKDIESHPSATPNIDSLKAKAQNLNEKIERGAMKRKHQKLTHNEDLEMEQQQIKALKMKFQLLNTID